GKAIEHTLSGLQFKGINEVRQGKFIELDIDETDPAKALEQIDAMCRGLLANTVIENYEIEIIE
ncbi:MAG: phosphoribosylformylglycinamidine synthase subunit PurS, partial [Rhodospirillaceae bacterium]|nr:phosphoribosylformylglycinamidine synthase subunit PurS [Rhodospirillaceae bacterium]